MPLARSQSKKGKGTTPASRVTPKTPFLHGITPGNPVEQHDDSVEVVPLLSQEIMCNQEEFEVALEPKTSYRIFHSSSRWTRRASPSAEYSKVDGNATLNEQYNEAFDGGLGMPTWPFVFFAECLQAQCVVSNSAVVDPQCVDFCVQSPVTENDLAELPPPPSEDGDEDDTPSLERKRHAVQPATARTSSARRVQELFLKRSSTTTTESSQTHFNKEALTGMQKSRVHNPDTAASTTTSLFRRRRMHYRGFAKNSVRRDSSKGAAKSEWYRRDESISIDFDSDQARMMTMVFFDSVETEESASTKE